MWLNSIDAKALVEAMAGRQLLGHGVGRLLLELARTKGIDIDEAAAALLAGRYWEELRL